jgi:hypothetical protein
MEEEFTFLASADEAEANLIYNRLNQAKIKCLLRDHPMDFLSEIAGGYNQFGKEILVLKTDLERARELLDLKDENLSRVKKIPLSSRLIVVLILVPTILAILVSIWILISNFLNR